MSRPGPRPHLWRVQGQEQHDQFVAWHRQRAQAHFRGETWNLSLEEFQELWQGHWARRGRGSTDYCMTRQDPEKPWDINNAVVMERQQQIRDRIERTTTQRRIKNGTHNKVHTS